MDVGWVLPVTWFGLGAVIVVSGVLAGRSRRAYDVGIVTVSVLWVLAGAAVNAWFLLRGDDYSGFADGSAFDFVTDTWESLVVPHHTLFIGLLVAFEAVAGLLVLVPGPLRQAALLLLVAFNVALLAFGWAYLVWTVPLVVALGLLWRSGRTGSHRGPHRRAVVHTA
jgi:uncharacterized membrane protein YphA (DoxX/SURF4 family)